MCLCMHLAENNARFLLLTVVLMGYMLAGTVLFQTLESDLEIQQAAEFRRDYQAFQEHHLRMCPLTLQKSQELLYAYGNASVIGIINKRRHWDFSGSFHFVVTIVSTIGYGNTVPQTKAGKLAVFFYGFFGCSGGTLFFNLFLERIITFLAWILRYWHTRKLKRRFRKNTLASRRVFKTSSNQRSSLSDILDDDDDDDDDELEQWKPSVYWVMFYLIVISCINTCCAAALYASLEGWSYFDALYFSFVSFTTIGFGDFVSTQKPSYPYIDWYKFANFIILVIGCSCMYSLLNVTSIVVKQGLNYLIHKLQCGNQNVAEPTLSRKQSVSTIYYSKKRLAKLVATDFVRTKDNLKIPRRMSDELISMKDFLPADKVSLAMMQKQLYDAARMQKDEESLAIISNKQMLESGAVGPLAIVSKKFENKN